MKDNLRVIPKKNYFILGIVLVVTCLILYYFYMWVDVYNDSKINRPILDKYMEVINYNELDNYLVENPDCIIYVSVLENMEIREFEKDFKVIFKNDEIDREILYMDITNDINDMMLSDELSNKYSINKGSVPYIVVFENGLKKSLYSVYENDMNVDKMINFINSWLEGIVIAVFVSVIIEMIIPEGKNKKYIKTIIGIYIMFVIISPIISNKNSINAEKLLKTTSNGYSTEIETINFNKFIVDINFV